MRDGFSFQAGAGGTTLGFAIYLKEMMKAAGVRGPLHPRRQHQVPRRDARAGPDRLHPRWPDPSTSTASAPCATTPATSTPSPFTSYNWHGKGCFATLLDAVVLGATEVDVHFNANVVTHSDGRLLHGIGGWQNCLSGQCVILPIPSVRDRIPVILDRVTTLVGPGELIDVVVTERGIAINPRRQDLLDATQGSGLPIRPIEDIKAEVDKLCGGEPAKPQLSDQVIAAIKWVDGTVIDCVRAVHG